MLSAGGMVATALIALVAPLLFNDVFEYPLLVVACPVALALLPGRSWLPPRQPGAATRAMVVRLLPYAAVATIVAAAIGKGSPAAALFVGVVLIVGATAILVGRTPTSLAISSAVAILALALAFAPHHLLRVRTFFGVTEVRAERGGLAHAEIHGTTLHGLQVLDTRRAEPTSYFVRSGPLGDVFDNLAERRPNGAAIGVTGLGVGTIAAYERSGDSMTYFEIDPAVVSLARDTRYFTYLAHAPARPRVLVGDGRLSLAEQPADSLDLLVLDAFSSDAVPSHLLTAEAMRTYLRTLRPGAVMAFQLTNRHFNLAPAVAATARSIGLDARARLYDPPITEKRRLAAQRSRWLVVGRAEDLAWFAQHGWTEPEDGPVLTDDHSSLMGLLRWN
jgi:hypothetical protein